MRTEEMLASNAREVAFLAGLLDPRLVFMLAPVHARI